MNHVAADMNFGVTPSKVPGTFMDEICTICGCSVHRKGEYAKPTPLGRSHATAHHYVAERFFGRSGNRRGTQLDAIFNTCPWDCEGKTVIFCYECHEELIHNPVMLPEDIRRFAELVKIRELGDEAKSMDRSRIAGRIQLLQEVIAKGIEKVLMAELRESLNENR